MGVPARLSARFYASLENREREPFLSLSFVDFLRRRLNLPEFEGALLSKTAGAGNGLIHAPWASTDG
jgi:hypothetical protein